VIGEKNRGRKNASIPEVVQGASEDPFPLFNPKNDVVEGQYIALTIELREIREGILFYIEKMLEFG